MITEATKPTPATPKTHSDAEAWHLCFRPVGDGPPTEIRVRILLKIALRRLGLRCIGYDRPLRRVRDGEQ
jgi:hypothetical protein